MANNKSALKRIKIGERNRLQNKFYKSSVKSLIKLIYKRLEIYNITKTTDDKIIAKFVLSKLFSVIDKATKKNVIHKNTAARKKAQLAEKLRYK